MNRCLEIPIQQHVMICYLEHTDEFGVHQFEAIYISSNSSEIGCFALFSKLARRHTIFCFKYATKMGHIIKARLYS